jgi:serine/threonine-protein kinase RsbW
MSLPSPAKRDFPPRLRLEHASRENLAEVRAFVQAQANAAGLSAEAVDDLVLAADEAATNIIIHGYGDRPGPLEVEFEVLEDRIRLTLRDQAPHFDPRQAPPPDLSLPFHERKAGGMGVFLIRKCMNTLDYRALEIGNELTLTKLIEC